MGDSCRCKLIKTEDIVKQEVEGIKEEYIDNEATSSSLGLLGRSFKKDLPNYYYFL